MNFPLILQSITIILTPFYILRGTFEVPFLQIFIPSLLTNSLPYTLLEVLILMTVVVTAYDFFKHKKRLSYLRTGLELPILFFLGSAILAVFSSWDMVGGLGILKAYFIEPILFFYCLIFTVRQNPGGYGYILNSLFITAFWMSVLGVLQKLTGGFTLAPHEIAQGRISALYNSANALAMFIGPVSILALAQFVKEKSQRQKYLYLGLFLLLTVVMIWTRSRGGLAGELGGIIIFSLVLIVFKIKTLKRYWYIFPVVGLLMATLVTFQFFHSLDFPPKPNYVQPYTEGDTLQIRLFLWTGTIHLLEDHPITGAGLNGFKTLYTNQYRLPQYQEEFQYPHNLLLTFWAETGILGLISFLILITWAMTLIVKSLSKDPLLGAALIGCFGYLIIHGTVDVPYFKNDLSLEFWILLGLVCALKRLKIKD